MKTDAFARLLYNTNPLLAAGYIPEKKDKFLKLIPKKPFKNNNHFYVIEGLADDPQSWDEEWFGNYE